MSSFGKDPRDMEGITPFGGGTMLQRRREQQAQIEQRRAQRGNGAAWKDLFRLPDTHVRYGRFIPGEYPQATQDGSIQTLEFVAYREHFNHSIGGKSVVCCAGPVDVAFEDAKPCLGCQINYEDRKIRNTNREHPGRVSSRPLYVFNWFDYGVWLNLPSNRVDPRTRQPYYNWTPVDQNDPNRGRFEEKIGHRTPWALSDAQYGSLLTYYERTIFSDCVACGAQMSVTAVSMVCGNPQCRQEVYNPATTTLTQKQRDDMDSSKHQCNACGQSTRITEILQCRNCGKQPPRRAQIFDVDLAVTMVKSGNNNNIQFVNRSGPFQPSFPLPGPIEDLLTRFQPTPYEKQAALWGIVLSGAPGQAPVQPPVQQQPYPQQHVQQPYPQQQPYVPPFVQPQQAYAPPAQQYMPQQQYVPQQQQFAPPAVQQPYTPPPQQAPYAPPQQPTPYLPPTPGVRYPGQR